MTWLAAVGAAGKQSQEAMMGMAGATSGENLFSSGMFDASGWNVNFGSGTITSDRKQTEAGELSPYLPYVVVGVVALLGLRYLKSKKG